MIESQCWVLHGGLSSEFIGGIRTTERLGILRFNHGSNWIHYLQLLRVQVSDMGNCRYLFGVVQFQELVRQELVRFRRR
ncbi:hypothetical protein SLEP1_g23665 [Rubroshorea leprosula]|uniref:Uncharacterized protein n=1 Tax=Rubroshorea leprosula TaxID=152421 RepID=A0AAV5JNI5_9ROSI|nr:hypothetical protein SLEP1_g23665 [Rubroshorea leprosula]